MIYLRKEVRELFSEERTFSDFLRIPTKCVRAFNNRHTGRFERHGRSFYIKVHRPSGWWPIAEEMLRLRKFQSGARPEWLALQEMQAIGIPAPRPVAFGECGARWATQQSFLITEEIAPAISLEELVNRPDIWPTSASYKRELVRAVAEIARNLHTSGMNHRDFYIGHFLLDVSQGMAAVEQKKPRLFLIDLHRAQQWRHIPRRWLVKDLGGLLFSAMDVGLTPRDFALFVRRYVGGSVRTELTRNRRFWADVTRCALKLYLKIHKKSPKDDINGLFGPGN